MEKLSNFKVRFTEDVLKNKYHMTEKGIEGYWANKEKEEQYNDKRRTAIAVGLGEALGTAGFSWWDITVGGGDCTVPVLICAGIAALTTSIAVFRKNPYEQEEYEEIDEDYERAKRKVKQAKRNSSK